jgi:hypothetical protein
MPLCIESRPIDCSDAEGRVGSAERHQLRGPRNEVVRPVHQPCHEFQKSCQGSGGPIVRANCEQHREAEENGEPSEHALLPPLLDAERPDYPDDRSAYDCNDERTGLELPVVCAFRHIYFHTAEPAKYRHPERRETDLGDGRDDQHYSHGFMDFRSVIIDPIGEPFAPSLEDHQQREREHGREEPRKTCLGTGTIDQDLRGPGTSGWHRLRDWFGRCTEQRVENVCVHLVHLLSSRGGYESMAARIALPQEMHAGIIIPY